MTADDEGDDSSRLLSRQGPDLQDGGASSETRDHIFASGGENPVYWPPAAPGAERHLRELRDDDDIPDRERSPPPFWWCLPVGGRRQHRRSARMLQTVARGTYFGSPGAGAEEGQPLRLRHRSSAARGEPSGAQRSRETAARIRPGCRAHAARRKRQMGEEVGSLSALQGCQRCERTLAVFSGLARRGGEPNVKERKK